MVRYPAPHFPGCPPCREKRKPRPEKPAGAGSGPEYPPRNRCPSGEKPEETLRTAGRQRTKKPAARAGSGIRQRILPVIRDERQPRRRKAHSRRERAGIPSPKPLPVRRKPRRNAAHGWRPTGKKKPAARGDGPECSRKGAYQWPMVSATPAVTHAPGSGMPPRSQ